MLALLDPTHLVKSAGYVAIFVLSVLQSCCVPTSSELTLGYAGVLAGQGQLSLPGAIAAGAAGETVGAVIAWFVGRYGGRAFVDRFGRYVLVTGRDLDRAEAFFTRRGTWAVLVSRLLPVIRNFVALFGGIAEVPLLPFVVYTAIGNIIWDGGMALIGYELAGTYTHVMKGFTDAGYLLGAAVVVLLAVAVWHRYRSFKAHEAEAAAAQEPVRD